MPVPFRDADEVDALGAAAYLKLDAAPDDSVICGALFFINARGEPVEFTYNRIETPNPFLWRSDDIRRHAARSLTTSLLAACSKVPLFIVCLADEVHAEMFSNEIHLAIPVCRVASLVKHAPQPSPEFQEAAESSEQMRLFWFPSQPESASSVERLFKRICARGLLLEPFDRAATGLREVYPDLARS